MKWNSSILVASSEGAKYYSYLVEHDSLILIMLQKNKQKKNLICSLLGFFVLQLKGAIFRITIQDKNVSVVTENRLWRGPHIPRESIYVRKIHKYNI